MPTLYLYLIIAIALLARGALYFLTWNKNKRRKDDIRNAIVFMLLSISFGLYGLEKGWAMATAGQYIVDMIICLVVVYSFVSSVLREIKRKG